MRLAGTFICSCGTAAGLRTQSISLRGKSPLVLVSLTEQLRSLRSGTDTHTPAQGGSAVCFRDTHRPRLEGVLVCAWLPVSYIIPLRTRASTALCDCHTALLGCKAGRPIQARYAA